MFKKTYGTLYEQNAYVFTDLFKELENYYAKGTVSHERGKIWMEKLKNKTFHLLEQIHLHF